MFSNKRINVRFQRVISVISVLGLCCFFYACGTGSDSGSDSDDGLPVVIVVNSLLDSANPPVGQITLRKAIADIPTGGVIAFDLSLNGLTIVLNIIGEEHSILRGEAYQGGDFLGYPERDYGKSALYTTKNLTIDASDLPNGITVAWGGGEGNPARVLAVYGNLVMNNVTLTAGFSKGEALAGDQPFTLARGGGLATWGKAILNNCVIHGNRVQGDYSPSRDRGAMGGGIYGNLMYLSDCIISGNWAKGYGATGGGVFSVGGEGTPDKGSIFTRCSICGNRVTGQHSYGGGIFTEGGGRGGNNWIDLINCTIARNLIEDNPDLPETGGPPPPQYYYRGGGVYMTNGSLAITSCTIVENEVTGIPAIFKGKPNMSGGGIAATIGDAHVVEHMEISHSIIAGNIVDGQDQDVYTGSLLHFLSGGYNLFRVIDFSEILVPIPAWESLSRKHWPMVGDLDGVDLSTILDLGGVQTHPTITSVGTDDGQNVVLWYPPAGNALNRIPEKSYKIEATLAEYTVYDGHEDDFLFQVLEKLRNDFGMGSTFGSSLNYVGVTWQGLDGSWASDPINDDWIKFWRDLDDELGDALGPVKLGDNFWGDFNAGPLGTNIDLSIIPWKNTFNLANEDQLGTDRPEDEKGDIGAIEQ